MKDPEEFAPVAPAEPDQAQSGKVIAFPVQAVRDPVKAAELKAKRIMDSLSAEQKLKLAIIQSFLGERNAAELMIEGISVDDLFRITAEKMFG